MSQEEKYTKQKVLWVKKHTDKHLSFAIERPESFRFSAGQFARLGIPDDRGIWRAYSMVSAEYDDYLEFFAVFIPNGPFSEHFKHLSVGDTLLLEKQATGFFLPERFQDGKELIMLSTGSGIAPFLSIIKQPQIWQRFDTLALIHSVSHSSELLYQDSMNELKNNEIFIDAGANFIYQPVLTREKKTGCLDKRLPELISDHTLSHALNLSFSQENTRFMICGNPQMVMDTNKALFSQGFTMNRVKTPGQILLENGF